MDLSNLNLSNLLSDLEDENKRLAAEIASATKKISVNENLISAWKEKFGESSYSGTPDHATQPIVIDSEGSDYGWLMVAIKKIASASAGINGNIFTVPDLITEIERQYVDKKPNRSSVHQVIKKMLEAKEIFMAQQGRGRIPAKYGMYSCH